MVLKVFALVFHPTWRDPELDGFDNDGRPDPPAGQTLNCGLGLLRKKLSYFLRIGSDFRWAADAFSPVNSTF